jgi:hypothetical protein
MSMDDLVRLKDAHTGTVVHGLGENAIAVVVVNEQEVVVLSARGNKE